MQFLARILIFVSATVIVAETKDNLGENNVAQLVGKDVDIFPDLPLGVIEGKNLLCRDQSRMYLENLRNLSLWAYEMRDSAGKSVQGILRGSIAQFGHFEECLTAKAPFPTQYCITTVTADVPVPDPPRDPRSLNYNPTESVLRKIYDKKDPAQQPENIALLGWCLPASCKPTDLQEYLNIYLATVDTPLRKHNVTFFSNIGEQSCQAQNEERNFDQVDVSFLLVTVMIILLVIGSTICDVMLKNEEKLFGGSPLRNLLISFSIKKNYPKLGVSEDSSPALRVLYGMRVFCICMIITDHRFGTFLSSAILNFNTVEEFRGDKIQNDSGNVAFLSYASVIHIITSSKLLIVFCCGVFTDWNLWLYVFSGEVTRQYRSFFGTLFFHGDLFVDSFFILSGLLVTYCLLVQWEKKFLNPGFVIVMRYVRLTPLYAYVVFFCATLFNFTGNGPMWKTIIEPEVRDCRQNWWTNLLYISNYVNADHMCMVHSWYLSCDFHYFIIAIFLSLLIHKKKKIGLTLLAIVFVGSILVPFVIVFVNTRPAVLFFYLDFIRSPKTHPDFLLTYIKSHGRSTPYVVGIIAGYLFFRMRQKKANLNWMTSYLIFIVSITLMVVSIVTGAIFYDPYYEYDTLDAAAYSALHRTVWSIGSIGVLYVATYGHVKWVYSFLSWRPWIPLSKLVYGAYLVHFQIQMRGVAKKGGADVTSYFDIISYAISDIVLSFGVAFLLYLAVEAPFRNIFSLLFVPQKEKKRNINNNGTEENVSETTSDSHL